MSKVEVDEVTGTETTGHEWDGIKELNTPMPRWWLWTFYATIIWALGYVIAYPAIPLVTSFTKGMLGYTTRAEVEADMAAARQAQSGMLDKIGSMSLEEIRTTPELFEFARAGGRSAYLVNCVQCHGSGATGAPGYPNLNDDDWLWGGKLDDISYTLNHGVRFDGDEQTRTSQMPGFGDGALEPAQISNVTELVLKMSGQDHDSEAATAGVAVYEENCASCHGEDGKGDREQGAPDLTDKIWLYGNSRASINTQIRTPKHGVMPGWKSRLDGNTIKQLVIYVHSLGGGE